MEFLSFWLQSVYHFLGVISPLVIICTTIIIRQWMRSAQAIQVAELEATNQHKPSINQTKKR